MKLALISFSLIFSLSNPLGGATTTLEWDASPDSTVIGYRLLWGPQTGAYSNSIDIDKDTLTATVEIPPIQPIFFVVYAVNAEGLMSDPSNEVFCLTGTTKLMELSYRAEQLVEGVWQSWKTNQLGVFSYFPGQQRRFFRVTKDGVEITTNLINESWEIFMRLPPVDNETRYYLDIK